MNNFFKTISLYIFLIICVTSWVITVFWTDLVFNPKIDKVEILSENVFLDDYKLNNNYIFYFSGNDLSQYKINSPCKIDWKFIDSRNDKYVFRVKYLEECLSPLVYLQTNDLDIVKWSKLKLNLYSKSRLFDFFVDRSNSSLQNIGKNIDKNISKLKENITNSPLLKAQIKRRLKELEYQKSFLNEILSFRKQKYVIPVAWNYKLPRNKSEIPNARRPYRDFYTDWIHHWWDIDAPLYTEVISIDYWKIIRIIDWFKFSDLERINRWDNLTYEDKLKNLDILRGNQIWVKTSKWDVIFYSHLSSSNNNLKVWDIVMPSQVVWKIGISGVPEKDYKKYHLHFPIHKNPYNKDKVWKYSISDYMKWDWYFKWKSLDYVLDNQDSIFR